MKILLCNLDEDASFSSPNSGCGENFSDGKNRQWCFLGSHGKMMLACRKVYNKWCEEENVYIGNRKKTIFFSLNLTSKYISTVSDLNTTSIWKVTSEIFKDFPQLSRDYHLKICHVFSMVKITFKSYLR